MDSVRREIMSMFKENLRLISVNTAYIIKNVSASEKEVRSALNSLVRRNYLSSEQKGKSRHYYIEQRKYFNPKKQNKEFIFTEESLLRTL